MEASPAPVETFRRPRLRWHVIYYVLAAFDILIVTGALVLNDRVMDMYVQAVAGNQEWGQLLADFSALEAQVGEIDAAGNEVFASHDAGLEGRRLEAAAAAFGERLAALRKDLLDTVPGEKAPPLLQALAEIDRSTVVLAGLARGVLAEFAAGDRELAARRMADMDRHYAGVLGLLRDTRSRFALARAPRPVAIPTPQAGVALKEDRWQGFARQTSAAVSMQRWEFVLALLIVMMVVAAVVYGRHIAGHMERDTAEKARHIALLREAREGLEQRVLERTRALRHSEDKLRRAAAEWQETFEAIESPVLLLDGEARIVRANRAAASQAGAQGDLSGRPVAEVGPGEPWPTLARLVAGLPEAGSVSAQVEDRARHRTWDVAINRLAHAQDGGARAIAVARDVTRIIELQDTVAREEKLAAMGRLVAGVAHEVRNPLFGISGTLDAFQLRQAQGEPFDKYLPVLRRDVGRLQALMRDLLDYGKPERLTLTPTAVESVVSEAVRACGQAGGDVEVDVAVPKDLPRVLGDRQRLVQVFQNLVQNAIEHAPAGSRVSVEAGLEPHPATGRAVWCAVRDSGSGFRPEDLPRLFEPFFTRRQGGTGLGLSIAQRIVQQHGGSITAENDPSGGAVVRVALPVMGG